MRAAEHELVPLTALLVQAFYGYTPPSTVRGYALLEHGEPIIVMGLRRTHLGWLAFSDAKEEARARRETFAMRRLVILCTRQFLELLRQTKAPVLAMANERFSGACELLERLGFERLEEGGYRWQA